MKTAIAFKYCGKGCGVDFYYGYSIGQAVGTIENDKNLGQIPLILFDSIPDLQKKSAPFDRILVVYLFRSTHALEIFREVVELKTFPNFITIAAGAHPSGDPEGTLKYFNYAIVGDCEISLKNLLDRLMNNEGVSGLDGVWYIEKDKIIKGGKAKPIDLNEIPPFAAKHKLIGPIEITRGCPWACKFCCVSYIYGVKPRHRKIEEIVKWVKVAKKEGKRIINFLTPNAFSYGSDSIQDARQLRRDKIEELLSSLAKIPGIKIIFGNYLSNVRPDFVNDDLIMLVKKYTQTPTIHMGGQSGSDRILKISNTGYTTDDIRRAVRIIKKNCLNASVDFIFGLPEETEEDRKQTLQFIKELITLGAKPRLHAFMPLPGTPWQNQPHGKLPDNYKFIFKELSSKGQVMTPFEYEELPYGCKE